jgi:hypothetical protein
MSNRQKMGYTVMVGKKTEDNKTLIDMDDQAQTYWTPIPRSRQGIHLSHSLQSGT